MYVVSQIVSNGSSARSLASDSETVVIMEGRTWFAAAATPMLKPAPPKVLFGNSSTVENLTIPILPMRYKELVGGSPDAVCTGGILNCRLLSQEYFPYGSCCTETNTTGRLLLLSRERNDSSLKVGFGGLRARALK